MIKGIGVDLVKIERVNEKHLKLSQKILTANELAAYNRLDSKRQAEFFAGRFAVKEAYYKASNNRSLGYLDIEILNDETGRPFTNIPGVKLSISHDGDYVVALVVIDE